MLSLEPSELERVILDGIERVTALRPGSGYALCEGRWVREAGLWQAIFEIAPISIYPGDDDLSFTSLALVVDRLGAALKLLPAIDHFVATRLLERAAGTDAAGLARRSLAAEVLLGLAVELDQIDRVTPPAALGGAICDAAVAIRRDGRIFAGTITDPAPAGRNLGDLPLASFGALEFEVSAASELVPMALSERRTLVAAAIGGMVREAVELAVVYAKDRVQFGQPIGSFQSIAHGLADGNVAAETIRILALKAAWSQSGDPSRFETLSRMAYAHAAEAGPAAIAFAMHVFGGYGNTPEYPVQAYFRSAQALILATGNFRPELRRIGRSAIAGERIAPPAAAPRAQAGGI